MSLYRNCLLYIYGKSRRGREGEDGVREREKERMELGRERERERMELGRERCEMFLFLLH